MLEISQICWSISDTTFKIFSNFVVKNKLQKSTIYKPFLIKIKSFIVYFKFNEKITTFRKLRIQLKCLVKFFMWFKSYTNKKLFLVVFCFWKYPSLKTLNFLKIFISKIILKFYSERLWVSLFKNNIGYNWLNISFKFVIKFVNINNELVLLKNVTCLFKIFIKSSRKYI